MTRTILAHGCFDIIHPGHLEHLRQAREMGGRLVVSITADQYVNKGPNRPAFPAEQRAAMLVALWFVDDVFICHDSSAIPAIQKYQPAVYAKGPDYHGKEGGKLAQEKAMVEAYGGRVAFTEGPQESSSRIINQHLQPPEGLEHINVSHLTVEHWLDKAAGCRAMVLGERIKDRYISVAPRFKSAKEHLIDYTYAKEEEYRGGSWIVAKHLEALCKQVRQWEDSNEVAKVRYVDAAFGQKLFAVNHLPGNPWSMPNPATDYTGVDMVVVADFGHGMFTQKALWSVRTAERFLALTVQSNGLNWGFNLLSKWPKADYFVVDEMELRLAAASSDGDLLELLDNQRQRMGSRVAAVTLGHNGCMVLDREGHVSIPRLSDKVVDRIGAGDAFLAATAPLAWADAPKEVIGLVGNAAAGLHVGVVGNSEAVTRRNITRVIKGVLA